MIITTYYTLKYDAEKDAYRVHSTEPPYCPLCGTLMSGYDTKHRKAIDGAGGVYWLILKRFRCPGCNSYHIQLPDRIQPYKQYEAAVIASPVDCCPAESSTIRRWKK